MKTSVQSIQARYALGLILSDELPALATELLGSGVESKSLVELACLSRDEHFVAKQLFERALVELGIAEMPQIMALRQFTKDVSLQILDLSITPYEGAKLIWNTYRATKVSGTHEFDPFIYAASEMEDRPNQRRRFERAIQEEAKRWIAKTVTPS